MVNTRGRGIRWVRGAAGACAAGALTLIAAGCGGSGGPPVTSDVGSYCAMARSVQIGAPGPFDNEGFVMRSLWPLAPQQLRNDYSVVLLAYEQVQDVADGAIRPDQVGVIRTPRLVQAMAQIDAYTEAQCGIHVASTLPSMTEY